MKLRKLLTLLLCSIMLMAACGAPAGDAGSSGAADSEAAADEGGEKEPYVVTLAGYRTGPYQHTGTPLGNGMQDMATYINDQGGVDGWPIKLMEIETGYDTPRGVEAYERGKTEGNMVTFIPFSTGTTYAVTPRAFEDKMPILQTGYGISAAASGEAFPYNFLLSPTYWTVEAASTQFIVDQEGGEEAMAGKKIALVYADIDYGRETIPLMETLAEELGFELQKFPVEWPGLEQTAVWSDIAGRSEPDWVILRMWGQSTVVSLQEAARVGFPMSNIIGCPWSPTDQDIDLAGAEIAKGVRANYWASSGTDIPIIATMLSDVHEADKGYGPIEEVGTQLYNRGVFNMGAAALAIQLSGEEFGHPLTSEQVVWGYEHLTPEAIADAGLTGLVPAELATSESDHMGSPYAQMHEFDGEKMVPIGEWTVAYEDIVQGLIEEAANAFKENNPELYEQ